MIPRRVALWFAAATACMGLATLALAATPDFTIVEPVDGATLKSPVPLRIAVHNAQLGSPKDGLYHLHFSVDGGQEVALYAPKDVTLKLTPGKHQIAVELAGPNHRAVGAAKTVTFTVAE